jgi:hypothetical protein
MTVDSCKGGNGRIGKYDLADYLEIRKQSALLVCKNTAGFTGRML